MYVYRWHQQQPKPVASPSCHIHYTFLNGFLQTYTNSMNKTNSLYFRLWFLCYCVAFGVRFSIFVFLVCDLCLYEKRESARSRAISLLFLSVFFAFFILVENNVKIMYNLYHIHSEMETSIRWFSCDTFFCCCCFVL